MTYANLYQLSRKAKIDMLFKITTIQMPTLYTIGHSVHPILEFISILKAHHIQLLIDVRTLPRSRRMPWFNQKALASRLQQEKIDYLHMPQLGGMRKPRENSINLAFRNEHFRGYADYMQTMEFFIALKALNKQIQQNDRVIIMCAEANPADCHRSLIADAEVARDVKVLHILKNADLEEHVLTKFAEVDKTQSPIIVSYPK